mgnify:CR=1 FL=1
MAAVAVAVSTVPAPHTTMEPLVMAAQVAVAQDQALSELIGQETIRVKRPLDRLVKMEEVVVVVVQVTPSLQAGAPGVAMAVLV